jgi:flagellar biosynthetic protein FliR
MELAFESRLITMVLLVATRLGAMLLVSPLFSITKVPVQFRVLLILAISLLTAMSIGIRPVMMPETLGDLIQAIVIEFVIGGLLAFGLFSAFAVFLFGGRILDFQVGFGVANLIDPSTNTQAPLIGTMLNMMAVMTFFLLDGHHMLIRGFFYSLDKVPPGHGLNNFPVEAVINQFGIMFIYGLALVAPAVFMLLLIDIGMSLAARTMPQMNIFIVGIPIKIFVGLTVLAISLGYMAPFVEKVFVSIFRYWEQVIR